LRGAVPGSKKDISRLLRRLEEKELPSTHENAEGQYTLVSCSIRSPPKRNPLKKNLKTKSRCDVKIGKRRKLNSILRHYGTTVINEYIFKNSHSTKLTTKIFK